MAICAALWVHARISTEGIVRPCCRWKSQNTANLPKISDGTQAAIESDYFSSVRERMLAGEEIPECRQCIVEEKAGDNVRSFREKLNIRYGHHLLNNPTPKIRYIELVFNTHCNLACRMCGEHSSSKWKLINNPKLTVDTSVEATNLNHYDSDLSELDAIKVVGGEPFLAKDHYDFLDKFITQVDNPENVEIAYHTNGTIFPNKNIIDYWKQLKKVKLVISVDAHGQLNEYCRPGSNWGTINENIKKFRNIKNADVTLGIHSVITSLNILQLNELIKWRYSKRIDGPIIPVKQPEHLAISHLPDKEKDKIRTYLDGLRIKYVGTSFESYIDKFDVIEEALNENPDERYTYEDIAEKEQKLDKYFHQDFWDYIPI